MMVRIVRNLLVCRPYYKHSMKRLTVNMKKECHNVLKMYAALRRMTMSEVAYDIISAHLQEEAKTNEQLRSLFEFNGISSDFR